VIPPGIELGKPSKGGSGDRGDLFTIREIPGKGVGMVATKAIPRGTRILVALEPDEQRRAFFRLDNIYPDEHDNKAFEIAKTHLLRLYTYEDAGNELGVLLQLTRIDNSCRPNVYET
jgi:hypothetical protein